MQIFYPKPLPKLIKKAVIHESGFARTEVAALQNGWRLVKRGITFHSSKISVKFFNDNYTLLEKFRNKDTGKFNSMSIFRHFQQMLNIYGSLIESGLNNMVFINGLMAEVSNQHKMFGVTYDDIQICYPQPLPDLIKEPLKLESGFTPTEVVALRNGWRLIKRRFNFHSSKASLEFFNKNHILLEKFCHKDTGKFNLTSLHRHSQQILNIYGVLIESGLNNLTFINVSMANVSCRHKKFGVTYDDIKLFTDYIAIYIMECLQNLSSPTFIRGLNKLNELINSHHHLKHEGEDNEPYNKSETSEMY